MRKRPGSAKGRGQAHGGGRTAALDAIAHQNHHFFVDKQHTGQVRWVVNRSDELMPPANCQGDDETS